MDRTFSYLCEEVALIVHADDPRHAPGVFARCDRFWPVPSPSQRSAAFRRLPPRGGESRTPSGRRMTLFDAVGAASAMGAPRRPFHEPYRE